MGFHSHRFGRGVTSALRVFRRLHDVAEQRDIRDRSNTARNWRDRSSYCNRAFEIDVAFQYAVDQRRADIDDGCARHQILAAYQAGSARRDDDDLGLLQMGPQRSRRSVQNSYRSILRKHEHRDGSSHDDRSSDHCGTPPAQRPMRAALEQ
jgi:hypothetical protein